MSVLDNSLLYLHIGAGFLAFFIGPGAMLTRKGSEWHRFWGKVFFWSMAIVASTAIVLATLFRTNVFLTMVAIFSFYSALSGYRVLYRKRPDRGQKANWLDWAAATTAVGSGIALLYLGLFEAGTLTPGFNPIMFVFGVIGTAIGVTDMRSFVRPFDPKTDRQSWYYAHMGNMLGAYIAAVSAFSVVNMQFLPQVVRWLWPSVIGVPLVILWTRYYRKKFESKRAGVATVNR